MHNVPDQHDYSRWNSDLPNRYFEYAGTDQHSERDCQQSGSKYCTPFVHENGGRIDGGFLSSDVDRTWDIFSPTEHDEEDRVSGNCRGEERESHKCGESREGDRECAHKDEIGKVGRHKHGRTW